MCWLSNKKPIAKIAKRDIPVKKVIYTDGTAYFNSFNYKTRKVIPKVKIEVEKETDIFGRSFYTIESGYHSYSSKCVIIKEEYNNLESKQCILVFGYNGFPLQVYYERQQKFRKVTIQNFIIPKGTKYYINKRGEYVSELIKIV
jgi:hypothetical protein